MGTSSVLNPQIPITTETASMTVGMEMIQSWSRGHIPGTADMYIPKRKNSVDKSEKNRNKPVPRGVPESVWSLKSLIENIDFYPLAWPH
jgi:hypothetical protein